MCRGACSPGTSTRLRGKRPISSMEQQVKVSAWPVDLTRPALAELVPYEPGSRSRRFSASSGLERVVKLASNEGQFGPFPAALEALRAGHPELQPLPGRRRVPARPAARGEARRRAVERRARCRRRRGHRVPLASRRSTRATRSSSAGRPSRATRSPRSRWARRRSASRSPTTPTTSSGCWPRSPSGRRSSTSATRTTRRGR